MNDKIRNMSVMNIKQTVERANASGINISEYTLRRAIRTRQLPCKVIGRTYLIPWDGFLRWVNCEQYAAHLSHDGSQFMIAVSQSHGKENVYGIHRTKI